MQGLYLLVWLPSLGSGLSGSFTPDTPGLIPHTSGSAPPTSLNRALQTASDLTARCPTPWEVGCVWARSSLGTAKSGRTEPAQLKPSEIGHEPQPVVRTGSGREVGKESLSSLFEGVWAALRKWGCWANTWPRLVVKRLRGILCEGLWSKSWEEGSSAGDSLRKCSQEKPRWKRKMWDRKEEEAKQGEAELEPKGPVSFERMEWFPVKSQALLAPRRGALEYKLCLPSLCHRRAGPSHTHT